jgi:predicted membrane chloride channel (bestrophin family)
MFRKPSFAVAVVSAILIIYCILINFEISLSIGYLIFGISPFLLIWLAYTIIRHGEYNGKELAEDEEWGYQDKNKEELGVF